MSDSTEARIERLRELERIRLEKQAALLAKRNSDEPVPMPKFVSSIQSKSDSNGENKENISTETTLFKGEDISNRKGKDEDVKVCLSEVKRTQPDDEPAQTVTEVIELPTLQTINPNISDTTLRASTSDVVGFESSKETIKASSALQSAKERLDSVSKISVEKVQLLSSDQSSVITEPTRTVSTSYVSGPLSPTSTEKTKISVVRKMKLDSLPAVNMKTSEHCSDQSLFSTSKNIVKTDMIDTKTEKIPKISSEAEDLSTDKIVDLLTTASTNDTSRSDISVPTSTVREACSKTEENVASLKCVKDSEDKSVSKLQFNAGQKGKHGLSSITAGIVEQSETVKCETAARDMPSHRSTFLASRRPYVSARSRSNYTEDDKTNQTETIISTDVKSTSDNLTSTNTIDSVGASHGKKSVSPSSNNINNVLSETSQVTVSMASTGANAQSTTSPTTSLSNTPAKSVVTGSEEPNQPSFRLGTLAMKQALEVSARIEEKFSNVTEDRSSQMAKLEELQRQRELRKKALEEEAQEDLSGLSVRERFFRNQSVGRACRQTRPQTIPEQIRASRLSRRNSDFQSGRTGSPCKAAEAESPPLARRSRNQQRSIDRLRRRTIDSVPHLGSASIARDISVERTSKPVLDMDSLDKAFARPDLERMSRIEELDRIRLRNKEIMKRRDSAPQVNADGIAESTSSRLDFPSSLIVTRGSTENIAQYPIHEHLESSFEIPQLTRSSTEDVTSRARELLRTVSIDRTSSSSSSFSRPPLRPSYSESRLFPLDGGRLSQSSILSISTDTELPRPQPSTIQQPSAISEENDDTPVYVEGSPRGTPVIDQEGRTHWLAPTSPKLNTYLTVLGNLQSRNRNSSHETSYALPVRPRTVDLANSLLDASNLDHYLAECFDKKYSLKERCALIKEKIYGKSKPGKNERGNPDGASQDCSLNKSETK